MAINYKGPGFWKGLKTFFSELKPMTWKQRIDHIWTYYKEHMFFAGIILMVIIAMIGSAVNAGKEVLINGIMVNISITQEGYNYLEGDYFEDLNGNKRTQAVRLNYANFSSLEDATYAEENYSAAMKLVGLVSGGHLDYIILDQFGMEFYIAQEVYLDLREFFSQEELDALGDRVIYAMEEGATERVPYAVDISELAFVKDTISKEKKTYFALSGNNPKLDMCRDVWDRLHAWKSEDK